ncbi:MAG: hypothetical protein IJO83_04370 [Clostridia bacterium]|nr:hypothetical protein [Clostridia bacterium]
MGENKRCCFAGHSKIYETNVSELLYRQIEFLICEKNVTEFWLGNYGDFDRLCISVLSQLRKFYKIKCFLIIPYLTKDIIENKNAYAKKYDGIYMADMPPNTPPRLKILKTNHYMVDNSDYLICFINTPWGGAAKTLEYAKNHNIDIISLIPQESRD